jgi:hypothetical protein
MRTLICFALAVTAACNWMTFDDLSNETWVSSTSKPSVKSSDYGVALQRGNKTGDDARLVVIGAGQPTYSELAFDAKGDSSFSSNSVRDLTADAITTLDPQPIVLADPTSDNVALVFNSGTSAIVVLEGKPGAMLSHHDVFATQTSADAATYMQAPNRTDTGHAGEAQPIQTLVASGEVVLGTFFGVVPNPQPKCKLTDGGTAILPKALGTVRRGMFDDVLAWGANGKLYKYDGDVFNGCATVKEPIASIATTFMPTRGAQILQLDQTHVLLQGHHENDDGPGYLQVFDGTAMTAVGAAMSVTGMRSAALLTTGSTTYVIVGEPNTIVDGKKAGQVELRKVLTSGVDSMVAATFHDAQPEDNEAFGRAVAAMPFHSNNQLIAVAANNEIFVYFRANLDDGSALYGETRTGR